MSEKKCLVRMMKWKGLWIRKNTYKSATKNGMRKRYVYGEGGKPVTKNVIKLSTLLLGISGEIQWEIII